MPESSRQVIAVAGVGNLGKYICEELRASGGEFDVVVLTRSQKSNEWCSSRNIPTHITNYSPSSILSILNTTSATTLISFINSANPQEYLSTHANMLTACQQSLRCKRLMPSEWIGDIDTFPLKPTFYARTRKPFRDMLEAQSEVGWTCFNMGWLADYFLPKEKTYMPPIPDEFPVDANGWRALVRGSGDEVQSWTCGRDVGRAVVRLCGYEGRWDKTTYVVGEWSTFNTAIKVMEKFYGRSMPCVFRSADEVQEKLAALSDSPVDNEEHILAQVEEMMVLECLACPREKTLAQRKRFFSGVEIRGLERLLEDARGIDFV